MRSKGESAGWLPTKVFLLDKRRKVPKESPFHPIPLSSCLRMALWQPSCTHQGKQAATLSVLVIYGRVTNYLKIITNVYDLTQFPSIRNPEMD